jgi:flagellar motor component MotA
MDDDEQGLIVLRTVGHRPLETEQLVELEVAGVRERHRPPRQSWVLNGGFVPALKGGLGAFGDPS